MAGGHIVVSTLGTTITGATGLRVVNAYVNEHKSFGVEKKRDGTGVPVIFASGFTTDKKDNWCDWERLIDTCYPNSPVYQVTRLPGALVLHCCLVSVEQKISPERSQK